MTSDNQSEPKNTHGPYSPVRQAGDLYFVSGQVGVDPVTKSADQGITGQTHQALKNLHVLLSAKGLDLNDVIKITIFLKNITDYGTVNDIYIGYFAEPRPARSCVEVSGLPRVADNELLIEIEAVAYKPEPEAEK